MGHGGAKNIAKKNSNRHDTERDVTVASSEQQAIALELGPLWKKVNVRHHVDLAPYGWENTQICWGDEKAVLEQILKEQGRAEELLGQYRTYNGFFLGGSKVPAKASNTKKKGEKNLTEKKKDFSGSYLEIEDKRTSGGVNDMLLLPEPGASGRWLGRLLGVREVTTVDGKVSVWAYVKIYWCTGIDEALYCRTFTESDRFSFFQLDDPQPRVNVRSRAHVVKHPTQREQYCLNTWLFRKHAATGVSPTEGFFNF